MNCRNLQWRLNHIQLNHTLSGQQGKGGRRGKGKGGHRRGSRRRQGRVGPVTKLGGQRIKSLEEIFLFSLPSTSTRSASTSSEMLSTKRVILSNSWLCRCCAVAADPCLAIHFLELSLQPDAAPRQAHAKKTVNCAQGHGVLQEPRILRVRHPKVGASLHRQARLHRQELQARVLRAATPLPSLCHPFDTPLTPL
jgi:hypothetical protein